jgi:hypothetical protein
MIMKNVVSCNNLALTTNMSVTIQYRSYLVSTKGSFLLEKNIPNHYLMQKT